MRVFIKVFTILVFLHSCSESRTIRYSGFDDLVVGVCEVKLFENGEFRLELGLGSKEGHYQMRGDTVLLKYSSERQNWPERVLMYNTYFKILNEVESDYTITRTK